MSEQAEQLFEVPRLAVNVDEADPNVIRVSFSGAVELRRGDPDDVEFYNELEPESVQRLTVSVYVAGAKTTHRRDSEGETDAVVQTKSVVVDGIHRG